MRGSSKARSLSSQLHYSHGQRGGHSRQQIQTAIIQADHDAANLRADQALSVAAQQRQVLADQAEQAMAAAERTLQEAVARAREEALREATTRYESELADRSARIIVSNPRT